VLGSKTPLNLGYTGLASKGRIISPFERKRLVGIYDNLPNKYLAGHFDQGIVRGLAHCLSQRMVARLVSIAVSGADIDGGGRLLGHLSQKEIAIRVIGVGDGTSSAVIRLDEAAGRVIGIGHGRSHGRRGQEKEDRKQWHNNPADHPLHVHGMSSGAYDVAVFGGSRPYFR